MKKYLVMLFGIISFLGLNSVNAVEVDIYYQYYFSENSSAPSGKDYYYTNRQNYSSDFLSSNAISDGEEFPTLDEIKSTSSELIEKYNQDYLEDYPYYFIYISKNANSSVRLNLCPQKYNGYFEDPIFNKKISCTISIEKTVNSSNDIFIHDYGSNFLSFEIFNYVSLNNPPKYGYLPFRYFGGTYEIYYYGSNTYNILDIDGNVIYTISKNNKIPSYLDLIKDQESYLEIDLNNYSYVALSLKNYNQYESFSTTFNYKGQLCLTPVYNYGLTEKKDILSGSKNQRCSIYQDNYVSSSVYVNKQDIDNHAIFYLKAYDKTKPNLVKIDQSVFNVSYITEENKDNPEVLIEDKLYPTIPFDKLTDTANKSEDEGYTDGVSCRVGDLNCYNEFNPDNVFDIFNKPLEFLKSIWNSITLVFTMINHFILLLPTTLQVFFYFSFTLAIILGIIKIIL